MSTLFSFPSKNQINVQGAVTENPDKWFIMFISGVLNFSVH